MNEIVKLLDTNLICMRTDISNESHIDLITDTNIYNFYTNLLCPHFYIL